MCICSLMCAFMLMSLIQWLNIAVDIIYITNKPSLLPFRMLRYALTEPKNPPVPDRYRVTDSLTLDMLHDFHHQLMNAVYVEGLVTGNFSPQVWSHPSRSVLTFDKGKCVGSLLSILVLWLRLLWDYLYVISVCGRVKHVCQIAGFFFFLRIHVEKQNFPHPIHVLSAPKTETEMFMNMYQSYSTYLW